VASIVEHAANTFERDLGAVVEQVDIKLPNPFEYFVAYWGPYTALEHIVALEHGADPTQTHPKIAELAERTGNMLAVDHLRAALYQREEIHRAFAEIFLDHDLLIWPTTSITAYPHPGEEGGPTEVEGVRVPEPTMENQRLTEAVSHAGYPAISVPAGFTADQLPVGLQIAAGHGQDGAVLNAAAALEAAAPWADRRPPV
jgi:Asp-tRNA(Asn)/Glu-tRNA(Gln) amidotransferase A subunit family amidase